jgi:predicted ATP-dependent endonuclease of OLD family
MKISKIRIKNFRLLEDLEVNLQENLSLVIGKNNTGKTSFLAILDRFLGSSQSTFSFDDFNVRSKERFKDKYENNQFTTNDEYGIQLETFIDYSDRDNLRHISQLFLNLSPDLNVVVLKFSYSIDFENYQKLRNDYSQFKTENPTSNNTILDFLDDSHTRYFNKKILSVSPDNSTHFKAIEDYKLVNKIISFKKINAKRDVINPDTDNKSSKTLSRQSSKYYEMISNADEQIDSLKELDKQLAIVDEDLDGVYDGIFSDVIAKVKRFGGIANEESNIIIKSALQGKNLLRDNTSVTYLQGDHLLPEDFNGLGYLNLISMIFEIEVIINDFKKKRSETETPSNINLLFIEEPEAHTHPQMQYIFIKNIKDLLEEERSGESDSVPIDLQTIISTHSSHITSESDFDDIKYFSRENINSVESKDLKELKKEYDVDSKQYKFLKKYLTINSSELFFADKAILIEGNSEKLILPTFMKKFDLENDSGEDYRPLTSQNISILETGAYSHIFEKFIDFLGIKVLILTDIDFIDGNKESTSSENAEGTSNSTINHFFECSIDNLKNLDITEKRFQKEDDKWVLNPEGHLLICFQTEYDGYHARSFEDAFIHQNIEFIRDNKESFKGLKHKDSFDNSNLSSYELAEKCIKKKTDFALDIIYNSNDSFSNWIIPDYIKEGFVWLTN